MASPLPRFVAISSTSTSTKNYFRPSGTDGVVKSKAVDVSAENVKHEVVKSQSQPGKIHLKCLDTGKYWSWDGNQSSGYWISAKQTNPLSVLSSTDCTLIKYSAHTSREGVAVFHLEFPWNSQWHSIKEGSGGLLTSGEYKGGSDYTNFLIQDWHQLAQANNNKKNIGSVPFRNMRIGN